MPSLQQNAVSDAAVKAAQNVPQLIAGLSSVDPGWLQQLVGKSLISSKSPPVTIAAAIIGWAVPHYGLACAATVTTACWSADDIATVSMVCGIAATAVASYAMRYFTKAPISGVTTQGPTP